MFVLTYNRTLVLKNHRKKSFSYETKPSMSFILMRSNEENEFMVPNHEMKWDYYENPHFSYCQPNFTSKKNGGMKSFSNGTKASMLFILTRRMNGAQLWNERRLLYEFMLVPIDQQTLILKNGQKGSFSYEIKASMFFILISRMSLWSLTMKRRRLLCESMFVLVENETLVLKNDG